MKLITELTDEHGSLTTKLIKVPIGEESSKILQLEEMVQIMKDNEGLGLTANQVGLTDKMFVMIINYGTEKEYIEYVINPVILTRGRETAIELEGCLSYPNKEIEIKRPRMIRVRYHNGHSLVKFKELKGLNARIFCHEMGHVKGECPLSKV